MPVNSMVIALVALAAIGWLAFLVASSVRGRGREEVAPNVAPFQTDDELETRRLDKVLASAVVLSAFLALSLPLYYLGEVNRQQGFVDEFDEAAVEHGSVLVAEFQCINCHGADLSGGSAPYLEKRSGISVSWLAPPLNDIFYRYDDDEVAFWTVYGRSLNSPMPAWGVEGGGPMNDQQVSDLIAYLHSVQISQEEALGQIEARWQVEVGRIENGDQTVAAAIEEQRQLVADIGQAPALAPVAEGLARDMEAAVEAAAGGLDTDGDGVSDVGETSVTEVSQRAADELGDPALATSLDPRNPESLAGLSDAAAAEQAASALESRALSLRVTADNQEKLLAQATGGLDFLLEAAELRLWDVDFSAVARASFGGDVAQARKAVGLYNAYCARCHTPGYSAGIPYQQETASGGFGPALFEGRTRVQFITAADMVQFIVVGSQQGVEYGVNGMGSGRMPGFGTTLSEQDIRLVVDYLRGDTLRGP